MSAPEEALRDLAAELRGGDSVISAHVVEADRTPALGVLVAAGERARAAPGEYARVIEAVREGYLLHYGAGRIVVGVEPDLALLAGDYLYALGLERLAALDDLGAVGELADLISLAAQVHDGSRDVERARGEAAALWLATALAIGGGADDEHRRAKDALRDGSPRAARALWASSSRSALAAGLADELAVAAEAIDFRPDPISTLG